MIFSQATTEVEVPYRSELAREPLVASQPHKSLNLHPESPRVMRQQLTYNDQSVLAALFDAEMSSRGAEAPSASNKADSKADPVIDEDTLRKEQKAIRKMNALTPSHADVQDALSLLDGICNAAPHYASVWCNRAQARRLLWELSNPAATNIMRLVRDDGQTLESILHDLDRAIGLASSKSGSTAVPTKSQASVLKAAHSHRGYLLWMLARVTVEFSSSELPAPLTGLDQGTLEEMASHEFALGGKNGHEVAKQISVKTNPYAKLCGSIVREAMKKEVEDYQCGLSR